MIFTRVNKKERRLAEEDGFLSRWVSDRSGGVVVTLGGGKRTLI